MAVVYGAMVSNGDVLLTNGSYGKPVLFAEEPTNLPVGYKTSMRYQELSDRIQQVFDIVPITGTAADAAVRLAEQQVQTLDDASVLDFIALLPEWDSNGIQYKKDFKLQYNGDAYKVLQAHKSQADWTPDAAHSLFVKIDPVTEADPDAVTEWVEKQNGIDEGYKKDQVVTHSGKYWKSLIDNNFYEPSAAAYAAWEDVTSQHES